MVAIKPLQYRRLLVRVTVAVVYGKPYMGEAERFHHNGEEPSVSRLKAPRISKNRYSNMQIQTGHIHLFDVYKFVAEHPKFVSGKDGDMGEYTKIVNQVVEHIPTKAGWYNWGRVNDVGFWETVYLGKSGNKKTSSLKARIKEEMLDERGAFWATVYGTEPTERQHQKIYKGKYGAGTRTYRKRNIHFIVWVGVDSATEEEIKEEEKTLIALYRPTINIQRVSYPPHTPHTESILRAFDAEIQRILK